MSELIYKYCDTESIKIFINKKLRLRLPNQFNDPFELSPYFDSSNLENEVDACLKDDQCRQFWYSLLSTHGYPESELNSKDKIKKAIIEFQISDFDRASKFFLDWMSKGFGVICLSKIHDDILMWSHYTEQHKGFVIGFDIDKLDPIGGRIEIDYGCKVKLPMIADPTKLNLTNYNLLLVFKRKHIQWQYENEVRLFGGLEERDSDGHYYIDLDPRSVVSIFLGCRSEAFLKKFFILLKQTPDFSHLRLFMMSKSEQCYKLNKTEI